MSELSWKHKAIIQALLSRGPLKENEFHSLFKDLAGRNPDFCQDHDFLIAFVITDTGSDEKIFKDYLLKINKALSYVHFELRGCIDQYDGEVYYGVVNTVSDEQSKLGTKYSVPQIVFYKAIIEAIVQDATGHGVLSNIEALNFKLDSQVTVAADQQSQGNQLQVPSALKYFSISQKEKTLDELVRDKWLNLTTDGNITLGVKSFLDLRSWFRNNDVPSCQVCNEAGVKSELCQNEACTARIHQYCLKQLFSQQKASKVCSSCGTPWRYTIPKAELIQNEDDNEPGGSQQATGSTRKRCRMDSAYKADIAESCNEDEQNECAGSQNSSGLARKRLRTHRTGDANNVGSDMSQSSQANSSLRRVTRRSARLM